MEEAQLQETFGDIHTLLKNECSEARVTSGSTQG